MKIKGKIKDIIAYIIVFGGIILIEVIGFMIQPKIDAWRIKKIQENLNQNIVVTIQK